MDDKVIAFATLLRQNGLRVSVAEDMDGFRALQCIGLSDRAACKDALRATIIKRGVDVPVFDELFDLYFSGLAPLLRPKPGHFQTSHQGRFKCFTKTCSTD